MCGFVVSFALTRLWSQREREKERERERERERDLIVTIFIPLVTVYYCFLLVFFKKKR